MGNINRIDLSKLKSHKSTFDSLEKSFNNSAYSTFNSSYIKRCSDPYVTKMKSNLTLLYNQIKKGYSNIDSWWTKYNQNAEGLEKKLSNEGNTITEYGIRAYATHLPELNDFKIPTTVSFASGGIPGALSGGLFANLGTVSANADPFAAIYSDYNIQNNIKEMVSDTNTKQDKEEAARMVGQGIAVSLTQALSPSLSSFLTTEQPKSILDHALDFLGDRAEDVGNFINDVGAQVSGAVTGIMDGVGSAVELIGEGILQLGNATLDVINRVAATASTFVTSAVKGFANAAEGVFDFAVSGLSIALTPFTWLGDLATGSQFNLTEQLHEITQAVISYDITESAASAIGNTEIGKAAGNWMKDKAILYDFFSTAGEVVGEVGFSLVSGGGWITAFMVGYGKGVESAYQNGASYGEGILSGGISGSLDAASYYLGGKIGGAYGKAAFAPIAGTGAKATIGNAGIRVGIDMLLGIGDSLLRPFSQFYQDGYTDPDGNYHSFEGMNVFEKYQVMFEQTGGLEGLAANATVGAAFSSLGEAFDLKRFFGRNVEKVSNKASNIKQNIKEKIADSQKLANGMTRKEMNNKLSRLKDLLEFTESDYYKKIKNDPYSWGEARQEVYMVDREINTLEYELRGTNQLKMLLDSVEFDKKVKIENLKRNYEASKTYASLNPEDIPGRNIDYDVIAKQMKEFSVTSDNLNVGDIDRLDIDRLKTLSLEEQKNIIDHLDTFNLESLCGKELQLSPEIKTILDNKIIADQDRIVLDAVTSFSKNNICRHIVNNSEIVKQLDDHNLAHMLSSATKANGGEIILEEAMKRIDQGRNIFGQAEIERNLFGMVSENLFAGASKLPEEYVDKIWNLGNQEIKGFFPEEMSSQMNFFQKSTISNLIKNNNLDENGNRIIKKLFDESPTNLKFFNFNVLDKSITNLFDDDFLMTIGKFAELGDKVVSLKNRNPELLKIYSQVIKNSNLDDSLNNRYVKSLLSLDFLFENQNSLKNLTLDNIDLDTLTDYILFYKTDFTNGQNLMEKVVVDLNDHFYDNLYDQCDNMFNQALKTGKLKDMKSAYFQKFFSITESDARGILEKYGKHLGEIDDLLDDASGEQVKTVLDYFNKVVHCEDVGELADIYENQLLKLSPEEMLHFDSLAALKYTETYEKAFLKTKHVIESLLPNATQLDYNGKIINILEAPDEFSMLVHSSDTGFVVDEKSLINDSYIDSWKQGNNPKIHGLATSFITNNNLGISPVQGKGVIYGFYDLKASDIFEMGPYDINSNIANYGFESANTQIFISADKMSSNTRRLYNEFVLSRFDSKPSCVIVYRDMDQNLLDNAYKAASEWNIPIIAIDKVKVAQSQMNQVNLKLDEFASTKDLKSLSEALDIYESGKSGFKLNEIAGQEAQRDTLEAIDNSQLNKIYDSSKIKSSIAEYINMLKDSNTSESSWKNLQNILEDELEKYRVVNENGSKVISKTELTLDIQKYLDEIKQHVHS